MKRTIRMLLGSLIGAAEFLGWFLAYSLVVYAVTGGAMVGLFGFAMIAIASVISSIGIMFVILKLED